MLARRLGSLGLLCALAALITSAVPAAAARPAVPDVTVTWDVGKPSPFMGTRFDGEWVLSQNRIYILGFRDATDATDGSIWYYDVDTKNYVDTGVDMPTPISNYKIAALRDANGLGLYTFGGRTGAATITNEVQVYYPATNSTDVIATDPYPGRSPSDCDVLPATGMSVVANKAYILGGLAFSSLGCVDENSAQTWEFSPNETPGNKWRQGPGLKVARGYITADTLGRKIYAIGGDQNSAGTLIPMATVESWDPTAGGGWNDVNVADLPVACDESQAFAFRRGALNKNIVLAGCGQWPNAVPDTYAYDANANTWTLVGFLNEARRNQAGAVIRAGARTTMYLLGGYAADGATVIASSELGVGRASASARVGAGSSSYSAGRSFSTN